MTCGVHLSASGGEDAGTLSGWRVAGPRAESGAGPKGFPGSIFIFISSILFFPFLIFDLKQILCNLIQNTSNKILSYSDIQHSVLNQ
jgi:hypothetical protein